MSTYVFVDGENHFIRSNEALTEIMDSPRAAEALSLVDWGRGATHFPTVIGDKRFLWSRDLGLFWDGALLAHPSKLAPHAGYILRATYTCACTGTLNQLYDARAQLRTFGFDPIVIDEPKDRLKRRQQNLHDLKVIDKAKGCDIAIATRMVADAAAGLYDVCFLFTSDADFIPAVEAVRRMGKVVIVFGYTGGLSKDRSPYLHVPDRFVDLGEHFKKLWESHGEPIKRSLENLGEAGPFNEPSRQT